MFMVGALLLVMLSFILTSIPNFNKVAPPRRANNPAATATVPPASNTVSSTQFTKQGTLNIVRKGNPDILELDIEVAQDDKKRAQGLMFRRHMEQNQGMLFIMDNFEQQGFYMRNTHIPLDIIYLDDKRQVVSIQKNTTPLSEETLYSNGPAKYVLEVNAGYCDTYGVKAGDAIKFHLF